MPNKNHILRYAYPEIFGAKGISGNQKKWFFKSDIFPFGLIVLTFFWLAWSSGHLEPIERVNKLRGQIEKTSSYFDDRASKTLDLIDTVRNKLESNGLMELKVYSEEALGGRVDAGERLENIEKSIARITLNKPNNDDIKERFEAAIEFAELSRKIVDGRDLRQYDLAFGVGSNASNADKKENKDVENITDSIIEAFDRFDLVSGGKADLLIDKGRLTISEAEKYLDPLSQDEKRAKNLLSQFEGLVMPKREHELLEIINREWSNQYFSLLNYWKSVRRLEISVDQAIERRNELLKRARLIEEQKIEREAQSDKIGFDQESETKKVVRKKVSSQDNIPKKPVSRTKVKPRPESREEKRKKALKLLDD